jgi:hypothetical protein
MIEEDLDPLYDGEEDCQHCSCFYCGGLSCCYCGAFSTEDDEEKEEFEGWRVWE